ncbi:MAG: MarR family winged helix-turn-helix transcriptional regulator, partial [Candidatus Adiutrix sp.]
MPMGELAATIGRKKNTVTSLIATLEARGYCHRKADDNDARIQWIHLSPKGENMRYVQETISKKLLSAAWLGISAEDSLTCLTVLNQIMVNLNHHGGKGGQ